MCNDSIKKSKIYNQTKTLLFLESKKYFVVIQRNDLLLNKIYLKKKLFYNDNFTIYQKKKIKKNVG